jgi:hypothetical protein
MNNVDAIIYAKTLTNELEISGLFDPEVDLFLDKEFTYDEILKTPLIMGKPERADECNGKALDWVIEKATKENRQLCFLLVCPAEEGEIIHVKVFYAVKEMNADGTPVHQM